MAAVFLCCVAYLAYWPAVHLIPWLIILNKSIPFFADCLQTLETSLSAPMIVSCIQLEGGGDGKTEAESTCFEHDMYTFFVCRIESFADTNSCEFAKIINIIILCLTKISHYRYT